jgi:DNA-binding transcriptional LysR family regulator
MERWFVFMGRSLEFNHPPIQLNLISMRKEGALPTLRQLELLLALPGAPSIAAAGARIGMSASATSHALRALESGLDCEIVDRLSPGVVVLTHAGELALPPARDVFASLQQVGAIASAAAGLHTGRLRIGSIGTSSSLRLLPPLLDRFRRRYPGIEVHVTERADAEIEQDLIGRRVDIGVVLLPQPTFDTQALATDEMVAVLPQAHPLAREKSVAVRDLAHYPLVLTQAGSQDMVMRMFERAGVQPKVAHELSQVTSILEFVARGNGVSVLAALAVPEHRPGLVFRPITPRTARRIAIACLDEKRLSPAALAFWKMARTETTAGRPAG